MKSNVQDFIMNFKFSSDLLLSTFILDTLFLIEILGHTWHSFDTKMKFKHKQIFPTFK